MFSNILTVLPALLALASAVPYNKFSLDRDLEESKNSMQYVKERAVQDLEKRQTTAGFIADVAGGSGYWLPSVQRQGTVPFGSDPGYKVYRNVKDYGAKGDGSSDDTVAINTAISDGNRCGAKCDSSTVKPALVYFPPGTYMVSQPIIQYYYTQFVGDAATPPTLKATPSFQGIAVIDSDPYDYNNGGLNWFTNQNNFFRQVRNFVIDLTAMPPSSGAGIHWQVAQATSLQNIRFEMVKGGNNNRQQGVFMDNGSGGFMTDLVFNGGNQGMFVGNQQFTTRNLTFNDVNTAIFMNWNWLWTFKSVNINNCRIGIDMANSPSNQTVGSVLLQDSRISNTGIGVNSSFSADSIPSGGGTLILDNVDFTGTQTAVQSSTGQMVLAGGNVVQSWAQGRTYAGSQGTRTQGNVPAASRPAALVQNGKIFERSKPQYQDLALTSFVSVKSKGAKGDGQTDDTKAIQDAINSLQDGQVLYFDHGAYIITSTVLVPGNKNIKITGEIWPLIMASGAFFQDQNNPKVVFQVGNPGDVGAVEMSDLIFETAGPAPGAVLMQWNSGASTIGANALYDVHFRIGGSAGTQLQSDKCSKNPTATHGPNAQCEGANLLFHTTQPASVYLENCWFWVADHELDLADHRQIDIYNGRGVLIESQGPVWMYGTSSEHSVLYQYQLQNASNVYMALIQSETPYFQSNPAAPAPFMLFEGDPQFDGQANQDNKAWGLRIVDSSDVLIYGAGLYSFFENYAQDCVAAQNCQNRMVSVEGTTANVNIFGLSTKAAVSMVSTQGSGYVTGNQRAVTQVLVPDTENRSNFCATIALWRPE